MRPLSSYSTSETCLADFSLFGGAESLPDAKQPAPWLPRRTKIPRPENAQDVYDSMPQDPSDFLWLMTEEPHRSRRRAIMQAHPEVSFETPYLCFCFVPSCILPSHDFLGVLGNA